MHVFFKAIAPTGLLAGLLAGMPLQALAAPAVQPASDSEVVEVLPSATRHRPALPFPSAPASASASASEAAAPAQPAPLTTAEAAQQAREAISVARQNGDTRYWGRAQAVLAPWWDAPAAPADLAVLQATVLQGRHEFSASRTLLHSVLERAPGHAQGWLNLASLERLSARYAESLAACAAVERAGQALYAQACRLETASLQGRHAQAAQGLQALLANTRDAGQRSWLLSLLAEAQERAGNDSAAARTYSASLAAEHDLYTAIAFSDLWLRTGQPTKALKVLAPLPETDAVVLRRAAAWKRLGDARWSAQRQLLTDRVQELERRGDDTALHGRELALAALWLDEDPGQALQLATRNLQLQREPLDWWVALQSARLAGQGEARKRLQADIAAAGLHDARLKTASMAAREAGQ